VVEADYDVEKATMNTILEQLTSKLQRAEEHIFHLEEGIAAGVDCDCVAFTDDPHTGDRTYYLTRQIDVPLWIPLMVGDIVHNLRSTLDHLAHHLVCIGRNSSGPFRHVYFPIFPSATKYKIGRDRKVRGMRQESIKAIDAIQPYWGGTGGDLWILDELDIIDKHRLLITVGMTNPYHSMSPSRREDTMKKFLGVSKLLLSPSEAASAFQTRPAAVKFPLEGGDILATIPRGEVDEYMQFTFDVAFGEPEILKGKALGVTLHRFAELVRGIVATFGNDGLL